MKDTTVKKKSIRKFIYNDTRRIMCESEFWKKIALRQQFILHAKNKT